MLSISVNSRFDLRTLLSKPSRLGTSGWEWAPPSTCCSASLSLLQREVSWSLSVPHNLILPKLHKVVSLLCGPDLTFLCFISLSALASQRDVLVERSPSLFLVQIPLGPWQVWGHLWDAFSLLSWLPPLGSTSCSALSGQLRLISKLRGPPSTTCGWLLCCSLVGIESQRWSLERDYQDVQNV